MQQVYMPLVYKLYKNKKIEKGLVIFADAHNEKLPFSMEKMREEVSKKKMYHQEYWVKDFSKLGLGGMLKFVTGFMKRYAVAEYVFICDNFLPVSACKKRKETQVIQLWHSGGLLKKSGYDTSEDIPKMYKGSVYKNYDLLTVSAPVCVPIFTHTMKLEKGVVQATGVSRTDYYFDKSWNEENKKSFYARYPEATGKKVIMWAPTFRGNAAMPTLQGMEAIKNIMEKTSDKYYWIIKLHPHLEHKYNVGGCDIPTERLFGIVDLMITDYSSVLFDYMTYSKPFLFFAPDLESFDSSRGFYVPYDSFPTTIVTDENNLEKAIEYELAQRNREEIEKCYQKHMSMCDGHATDRIIRKINMEHR